MQIYAARHDESGWNIAQVSDWKGYRWDFSGGGSIVSEMSVGAVEPLGSGRLALAYRYGRGSGTWVLDETTLRPIPGATPPRRKERPLPNLGKIESPFPGVQRHRIMDSGAPPPGVQYMLTWEALAANRDRPRTGPLPEPSMLRVIEISNTAH